MAERKDRILSQQKNENSSKRPTRQTGGFLIFAGTSEGRELAQFLSGQKIPAAVCVATEYGEEVLPDMPGIQILTGRMDRDGMEKLMKKIRPMAVIDATHPYAEAVTENIADACENTGLKYVRLLREETDLEDISGVCVFDDCESAAEWLDQQEGIILLTTGMKELPVFADGIDRKERIFVRALPQEDVFDRMEQYGFSRKQVICMQGPFSREMNVATIQMVHADFLVTKESGASGGFSEKVEAARDTGAICVVIRRPVQKDGYSMDEVRRLAVRMWKESRLEEKKRYRIPEWMSVEAKKQISQEKEAGRLPEKADDPEKQEVTGKSVADQRMKEDAVAGKAALAAAEMEAETAEENAEQPETSRMEETEEPEAEREKRITFLGTGLGSRETMTVEAVNACRDADCIIGAPRILDTLEAFEKPMIPFSRSEEIISFLLEHPEYRKTVIAFSGDVGFYSGAKRLIEKLEEEEAFSNYQIHMVSGVSTVSYFAAKLQISWDNMVLMSVHGREQNLAGAIRKNEKVFALASDAASIRSIADRLVSLGMGEVEMYVGVDLSYPTEQICRGEVCDFTEFDREGICAVIFCNPGAGNAVCVHGIPDEEFLRGKVPMTKEEVRSISISRLRLTRDAVVYDVGAGTGSVSVECARMADRGKVYAIEWKEDAWKIVAENRKKFGVSNLEIIPGRAPEVLRDLPAPTHAFVGGSGGSLKAILRTLVRKNPEVRIVVNCITLETICEVMESARDLDLTIEDIVSVTAARAKIMGDHHMMTGQNPVYVIVLWHEKCEG